MDVTISNNHDSLENDEMRENGKNDILNENDDYKERDGTDDGLVYSNKGSAVAATASPALQMEKDQENEIMNNVDVINKSTQMQQEEQEVRESNNNEGFEEDDDDGMDRQIPLSQALLPDTILEEEEEEEEENKQENDDENDEKQSNQSGRVNEITPKNYGSPGSFKHGDHFRVSRGRVSPYSNSPSPLSRTMSLKSDEYGSRVTTQYASNTRDKYSQIKKSNSDLSKRIHTLYSPTSSSLLDDERKVKSTNVLESKRSHLSSLSSRESNSSVSSLSAFDLLSPKSRAILTNVLSRSSFSTEREAVTLGKSLFEKQKLGMQRSSAEDVTENMEKKKLRGTPFLSASSDDFFDRSRHSRYSTSTSSSEATGDTSISPNHYRIAQSPSNKLGSVRRTTSFREVVILTSKPTFSRIHERRSMPHMKAGNEKVKAEDVDNSKEREASGKSKVDIKNNENWERELDIQSVISDETEDEDFAAINNTNE